MVAAVGSPEFANPAGNAPPGPASAPNEAPMTTPQEPAGDVAMAELAIHEAMQLLMRALPAYGPTSKEGGELLSVLKSLGRAFGEQEQRGREMVPAEIMQHLQALGGDAGGNAQPQQMPTGPTPVAAPGA